GPVPVPPAPPRPPVAAPLPAVLLAAPDDTAPVVALPAPPAPLPRRIAAARLAAMLSMSLALPLPPLLAEPPVPPSPPSPSPFALASDDCESVNVTRADGPMATVAPPSVLLVARADTSWSFDWRLV